MLMFDKLYENTAFIEKIICRIRTMRIIGCYNKDF